VLQNVLISSSFLYSYGLRVRVVTFLEITVQSYPSDVYCTFHLPHQGLCPGKYAKLCTCVKNSLLKYGSQVRVEMTGVGPCEGVLRKAAVDAGLVPVAVLTPTELECSELGRLLIVQKFST
jgi:hypothetical protein